VTATVDALGRVARNLSYLPHEGSVSGACRKLRRTHHRQVFGLAGVATRPKGRVAFPSDRRFPGRRCRPSALWRSSFPFTAAGQSRIHAGFPFNPIGQRAPISTVGHAVVSASRRKVNGARGRPRAGRKNVPSARQRTHTGSRRIVFGVTHEPHWDRPRCSSKSRTNPSGAIPVLVWVTHEPKGERTRSSLGSRTNRTGIAHAPPCGHARTQGGSRTTLVGITHEPNWDRLRSFFG
jgi:hypothetical protein